MGEPVEPRFRVRTATMDGRKTQNFVPVALEPTCALADAGKTDLVFIPTAGMDLVESRTRNAELVQWLAERGKQGGAVAGVCTGVSLLAAAGLLDGRPATTHWGVINQCRALYPAVNWNTDRFVTESENVFCGGGL